MNSQSRSSALGRCPEVNLSNPNWIEPSSRGCRVSGHPGCSRDNSHFNLEEVVSYGYIAKGCLQVRGADAIYFGIGI